MSEWYDSQKKPSSNILGLIREQIAKSNATRELSAADQKRLSKLQGIAEKLKRGENVQNRQLQTWLSDEEYEQIESQWQYQLELREELKEKPSALKRYEDKLKEAIFFHNRAEFYSNKGKHKNAKKFYYKTEGICENALEILQEILQSDTSLYAWFDRAISFDVDGGLGADIALLPRLVTSRSNQKISEDCRISTKQSVKLGVVENAIRNIGRVASTESKATKTELDKFLRIDD